MFSKFPSLDDGAKPPVPCAPPPGLILLLVLNGAIGKSALRQSHTLRSIAEYKLTKVLLDDAESLSSLHKRRSIAVVSRALQRAIAPQEETLNPAAAPFIPERLRARSHGSEASHIPSLQVTASVSGSSPSINQRRQGPTAAIRRSQSVSNGYWNTHCGTSIDQAFHPQAAANVRQEWTKSELADHDQILQSLSFSDTANKEVASLRTLEHLQEKELKVPLYGCKIVPIYEDKQSRYRALRIREETRWHQRKSECPSIQQLATASISLSERSPEFLHVRNDASPHVSRLCRPNELRRASNSLTSPHDTHDPYHRHTGKQLVPAIYATKISDYMDVLPHSLSEDHRPIHLGKH